MLIPKKIANQIVNEIEKVIDNQVNFMNVSGYILASSDADRIGDLHVGAQTVIEEKLDQLIITSNNQFPGSKEGINLPLIFDDNIIGVIGISGPIEQVEALGKVIKKMTEILLISKFNKEREEAQLKIKERFVEEWVTTTVLTKERKNHLLKKAKKFDYDIDSKKRILLIDLCITENDEHTDDKINEIDQILKNTVEEKHSFIYSKLYSQRICILNECDDPFILDFAEKLTKKMKKRVDICIQIGIDSFAAKNIHEAYIQAQKALSAVTDHEENIQLYSNLTFELLLEETSFNAQKQFIDKIFADYPTEELIKEIDFLQVYYTYHGSIKNTAEALFIHPNTLQYRLKKIKNKTGYDPRNLKDAAYFNMIISIINWNRDKFCSPY